MSEPVRCPICRTKVPPDGAQMPFCSERCRLLDLGNWASEKYVIPAPLQDSDDKELPDPPESAHEL